MEFLFHVYIVWKLHKLQSSICLWFQYVMFVLYKFCCTHVMLPVYAFGVIELLIIMIIENETYHRQ